MRRQNWQPPATFVVHTRPCWKSALTFLQLTDGQFCAWHAEACTSSAMVRCSCFWRRRRSSSLRPPCRCDLAPCGLSGCGWWVRFLQSSQTSKSGHVSHRQPAPGSISCWQMLHEAANAGSAGLCRWNSTIIEVCFARRSVSNWKWLPWQSDRNAWRVSMNSHSSVSSSSLVSPSGPISSHCNGRGSRSCSGSACTTPWHSSHRL
mmetsp:Transcript_24255/g.82878  ORF Transcript_24255/g.82878 Transcript_24255/m.82878 type:complete len:205 (-) Transcript_24255:3250-3864(-)